jgi:imidazolonepropionase-like amidohydrolase
MTPLQAIRIATISGAELIGWQDRAGAIEAGKYADLIAVEGDPLRAIHPLQEVEFVMKGGKVVKATLNAWRSVAEPDSRLVFASVEPIETR